MKKITPILLLFILIAMPAAFAQNLLTGELAYPQSEWSLEECMRYAVENSPSVVRQKLTNANYRSQYNQALLNHLPNLSGSSQLNSSFGRNVDYESNTYTTSSTIYNGYSISAGITIFNGLDRINSTRQAKIARLRGDEEKTKIEDDAALATMTAFFNLAYSMGSERLAREQLQEARSNLALAQRKMELGLASLADVAQFEADVATYEYELITVENKLRTNELQLKEKMNFPLGDNLVIDTTARYVDPRPETADMNEIVRFAVDHLPAGKMTAFDIRTQKLNVSTARASLFPSLTASGSIGTNYNGYLSGGSDYEVKPFGTQIKDKFNQSAGLSMSIPIFNAWSRQGALTRAKNTLKIREVDHYETMRQIAVEVEQAVLDLNGALAQMQQAEKQVRARELSYRVAEQQYREGLISALDLQTTSNQLLSAKATLLNVSLTWQSKRKEVDYYKGIPLLSDY